MYYRRHLDVKCQYEYDLIFTINPDRPISFIVFYIVCIWSFFIRLIMKLRGIRAKFSGSGTGTECWKILDAGLRLKPRFQRDPGLRPWPRFVVRGILGLSFCELTRTRNVSRKLLVTGTESRIVLKIFVRKIFIRNSAFFF